ncbi:HAD family hydrolase [Microbacterium sp. G2-8]|uniref:HAD family hydrolase n=1 Tax=Microbacterium sp. G2-8 TaxID=2842454 RepID=UPI001C89F078|nr:HAD family hydrolase [Microbacterium sp. G2-8]
MLFDLDETLIAHETAADRAVEEWAGLVRGDVRGAAERWRQISAPHYARYQRREISFPEQRRARVREFFGRMLTDDEADSLFAQYLPLYERAWSLYPDAIPCLARARRAGCVVGVLTNGEREQQARKIDRFGLGAHVDHVICSSDLSAGKPDPRAFAEAVRIIGVSPDETLMIGDSLENDARGALAAGLDAVLVDRGGVHADSGVASVTSLDEVEFA